MNTAMILICIWLICRLCTALHTKCCGAVVVNLILDVVNNLPCLDKLSCSPLNDLQFSCLVRKANKSAFVSESGMPVVYPVHSRFISLC